MTSSGLVETYRRFGGTVVNFYQTTRPYIPGESIILV
jgi:hypothetical protein